MYSQPIQMLMYNLCDKLRIEKTFCFRYTEDGYLSGDGNVTTGKYERMEWNFSEEVKSVDTCEIISIPSILLGC